MREANNEPINYNSSELYTNESPLPIDVNFGTYNESIENGTPFYRKLDYEYDEDIGNVKTSNLENLRMRYSEDSLKISTNFTEMRDEIVKESLIDGAFEIFEATSTEQNITTIDIRAK